MLGRSIRTMRALTWLGELQKEDGSSGLKAGYKGVMGSVRVGIFEQDGRAVGTPGRVEVRDGAGLGTGCERG